MLWLYRIWTNVLVVSQLLWLAACLGFTAEPEWQAKCLQSPSCMPQRQCQTDSDVDSARAWPVCLEDFRYKGCLVYSVGLAQGWHFDQQMGQLGCEVHLFDPVADLPTELAPNVTFHRWGIKSTGSTSSSQPVSELSERRPDHLYTLSEIRERLGHQKQMTVLKLDCNGCEWKLLKDLAAEQLMLPDHLALTFNFNFSQGHSKSGPQGLPDIASAFEYLNKGDYERSLWRSSVEAEALTRALQHSTFPFKVYHTDMIFSRQMDSAPKPTRATGLSSVLQVLAKWAEHALKQVFVAAQTLKQVARRFLK